MSEANGGGAASLSTGHNSANAEVTAQPDLPFQLSGSQKKTKRAIEINIERMCREAGLERVGFLTLTVGDDGPGGFVQIWDSAEANRRINNLARRFLPSLFPRWIIITERHKSGAIHYHLCVETTADIREGFDWEAVRRGDYSSANAALRKLWAILREQLPESGFGRAQLEPAKGAESMANYLAKYVEKNLFNRLAEDFGKKLVRYGGWNKTHCRANDISWATPGARLWRLAAAKIAEPAEIERAEVAKFCGPKWAWFYTQIMGAELIEWPNLLAQLMQREIARRTPEIMDRKLTEEENRALQVDLEDAEMWGAIA